ncbi:PREDICTED: uncharacterized protein At4g04775-like [Camelina sativa]|uniref:Uncharacterized protein At4g04775-like n=1 Tax=Camelina sativa TaxID=90675 RepID=A0ABM0URX0_CAMSA|nr:PREDICTED: uncharacterized protein At4g04775-like [Camelina sativa]
MLSQSSGSDPNSSRIWGPLCCNCGRATTLVKSLTNENPGRRFFKCVVHGFAKWADEEKPYGWQKVSLLEAKDEMKVLKESLKAMNVSGSTALSHDLVNKPEEEKKKVEIEENKKLESEVMAANEREKMLRQFILLSWGGFIVVIAMILVMAKI